MGRVSVSIERSLGVHPLSVEVWRDNESGSGAWRGGGVFMRTFCARKLHRKKTPTNYVDKVDVLAICGNKFAKQTSFQLRRYSLE